MNYFSPSMIALSYPFVQDCAILASDLGFLHGMMHRLAILRCCSIQDHHLDSGAGFRVGILSDAAKYEVPFR
jgi:hypothetical protein